MYIYPQPARRTVVPAPTYTTVETRTQDVLHVMITTRNTTARMPPVTATTTSTASVSTYFFQMYWRYLLNCVFENGSVVHGKT